MLPGATTTLSDLPGTSSAWFVKPMYLNYNGNASAKPVPAGNHTLSVHFTPTGKNLKPDWFSGDVVLAVDGDKVGELKGSGQRRRTHR